MALKHIKLSKGKYAVISEKGLRFIFNWKRNVAILKISPKELEKLVKALEKKKRG